LAADVLKAPYRLYVRLANNKNADVITAIAQSVYIADAYIAEEQKTPNALPRKD